EPAPPLAHRIGGNPQAGGDPGVIPAARGGEHDLRPQPVPPARLRAAGSFLQRLALGGGQRDRHGGRQRQAAAPAIKLINSGHRIITRTGSRRRHDGAPARYPGLHPQLHHLAAAGPRREALAPAGQGSGHLPRRVRLRRRGPARRRADPAVPAPLRRLRPLLPASPSTPPPANASKTPSCSPASPPEARKKPSIPPARSTSPASGTNPNTEAPRRP